MSVVARLALKLPISQLEINTFGHILSAFAILSIWWKKLKDVKVRTEIRDPWAKPVCAYLWMSSQFSSASCFNGPEIRDVFPILGEGREITAEDRSETDDQLQREKHSSDENQADPESTKRTTQSRTTRQPKQRARHRASCIRNQASPRQRRNKQTIYKTGFTSLGHGSGILRCCCLREQWRF